MTTKKKGAKTSRRPKLTKRTPVIPTDDQLEARRRRVVELWAVSDRLLARQLIKEGYFVAPANGRVAPDPVAFEESCRRTVSNDRQAIRLQWREGKKELTSADRNESTEEYVARLQSRIDQITERLMTTAVKDTAYAALVDSLLRYEVAIAKARGTDEAPPADPDGGDVGRDVPFLGLVMGFENVSPEARKKIDEWQAKRQAKRKSS